MTTIDWVLLAVLGISSLIGLKRGFVKEAFSIASWAAAFIIARLFSGNLATLLAGSIDTQSLRWGIAFAILFAGTLVIGAMLNYLLGAIVKMTGLSGTDRMFGMVFGLLRGVIVLVALVYGLQYTMVPQDAWWKEAALLPHLESMADWARQTLPGAKEHVMSLAK